MLFSKTAHFIFRYHDGHSLDGERFEVAFEFANNLHKDDLFSIYSFASKPQWWFESPELLTRFKGHQFIVTKRRWVCDGEGIEKDNEAGDTGVFLSIEFQWLAVDER